MRLMRRASDAASKLSSVTVHHEKPTAVQMGAASVAGRKRSVVAKVSQGLIVGNEDRVEIDSEHGLAAVFDGHGGSLCADFLARHALERLREALDDRGLLEALRAQHPGMGADSSRDTSASASHHRNHHELTETDLAGVELGEEEEESESSEERVHVHNAADLELTEVIEGVHDALKETCAALESEFKEICERTGDTSGACAMFTVIYGSVCVIAYCGDCRAVYRNVHLKSHSLIHKRRHTIQATEDHRVTTSSEERIRVLEAGGVIEHGRVAALSPSRTFGDWDIKNAIGPDIVTAVPQIVIVPVREPMVMILATDGVWDAMSNKRALDIVIKNLRSHPGSFHQSAGLLCKAATHGASDDASCVVLHIEPK